MLQMHWPWRFATPTAIDSKKRPRLGGPAGCEKAANMNLPSILLLVLLTPQETFTQFTFCRDSTRGPVETQCVQVDPSGSGEVRFKRRGSDEIQLPLTLSAAARERYISVLTGTNYLS